jgi:hypothetical protein
MFPYLLADFLRKTGDGCNLNDGSNKEISDCRVTPNEVLQLIKNLIQCEPRLRIPILQVREENVHKVLRIILVQLVPGRMRRVEHK